MVRCKLKNMVALQKLELFFYEYAVNTIRDEYPLTVNYRNDGLLWLTVVG